MKKIIRQATETFALTFVSVSLYCFIVVSSISLPSTSKVHASSDLKSNIYNYNIAKSDTLCQNSLPTTTIQIEDQKIVYSCPSSSRTIVGFVKNQQVKLLNSEDNYYYIEYTYLDNVCRGYIEQSSLSSNVQIPVVDYSRTRQTAYINKSATIYNGPSDTYKKIDKISEQEILLLNKEDDWYLIEYTFSRQTKRGYIKSDSITLDSSINTPTSSKASKVSNSLDEKTKTLIANAQAEIGFVGSGEDGNITKYGLWYGVDNSSWSATFITWVADQSKLQEVIPRVSSYDDSLAWFKNRHLWGDTPKIGAIVFFKDKDVDYVGIVEAVNNDDTLTVLVGGYPINNTKQVARINIKSKNTSIAGYGYPQYSLSGLGYSEENGHTTIYSGPSNEYSQISTIDNEMVKILNKENNFFFIEYNISGIKSRGYIDSNYVTANLEITTANYSNSKKLGQATTLTTIYNGPSTDYATNGFIENQQVTILNKEDNWYFIEYTTANVKKRGYVAVDYIKLVIPPSADTAKKTSNSGNSNSGTTDVGAYVYKFTDSIITSYNHKGCGAAGEDYYCDGSGKIAAAHNMRAGTVIYIPDLKYINSTGIFTVGDTGGPFFDFDINTNQDIDKGPHDVYVLSWGDGPMMQSFDAAKQEQVRYNQWNRYKSMYENYKFQTENFTQP